MTEKNTNIMSNKKHIQNHKRKEIKAGDLVLIYLDTSKEFFYLAIVNEIWGGGFFAEWNIGIGSFFLFSNYKIEVIDNGIWQ